MRSFAIVVAADRERGIARRGKLPWHLPGDLRHFAVLTKTTTRPATQNAVFMGRKTWATIPPRFRPLLGRLNVVLSRRPTLDLPPGVLHAGSLEEALGVIDGARWREAIESVFCVGGAMVYGEAIAMPQCQRIYYTRIDALFQCDTFFPPFEDDFALDDVMKESCEGGIVYRMEVWRRRG